MKKLLENVVSSSIARVILSLLVGFFIGIKAPEGVRITCNVANILDVKVRQCEEDGTL